jgi:hypothetical protein
VPFTIQVGHAQRDGRKFVLEVHSDAQGEHSRIEYLADPLADFNAIATAREPVLISGLAEQEARATVDLNLQPNPRFQTEDGLLLKVRQRYLASKGEETCRIARWIVDRLNDASVTVVQMRTAWGGIPTNQWNAINGRMDTFANAITAADAAVGE